MKRTPATLAAALALPERIPHGSYSRPLFVWLAFSVIVVTLVLQGLTLPLVARRLRIEPDDPREDALAEAGVQQAASRAAQQRLDTELSRNGEVPESVVERLRAKLNDRTNLAWERLGFDPLITVHQRRIDPRTVQQYARTEATTRTS